MEHDRFKDESDILSDADGSDREVDFEEYLRTRRSAWREVSQTTELTEPLVSSPEDKSAGDAEESSEAEQSSGVIGHDESLLSPSARGAVNQQTVLVTHKHPVVGSYVTETLVPARVDPEYTKIAQMTYEHPEESIPILIEHVIKATFTTRFSMPAKPEEVIEHFHKIERCIFLLRAQQGTLRGSILEDMLAAETTARRQELLDLDAKERAKQGRKAASSAGKSDKPKTPKGLAKSGKSKGHKAADQLMSLGFDQATLEKNLKAQGLLDESTTAYVAKLFA